MQVETSHPLVFLCGVLSCSNPLYPIYLLADKYWTVGLHEPYGSIPIWNIPQFCHSISSLILPESAVPARSHEDKECTPELILTSANLQNDLVVMERILMENIFQPKLAVYRQIPVLIGLFLARCPLSSHKFLIFH